METGLGMSRKGKVIGYEHVVEARTNEAIVNLQWPERDVEGFALLEAF